MKYNGRRLSWKFVKEKVITNPYGKVLKSTVFMGFIIGSYTLDWGIVLVRFLFLVILFNLSGHSSLTTAKHVFLIPEVNCRNTQRRTGRATLLHMVNTIFPFTSNWLVDFRPLLKLWLSYNCKLFLSWFKADFTTLESISSVWQDHFWFSWSVWSRLLAIYFVVRAVLTLCAFSKRSMFHQILSILLNKLYYTYQYQ